MLTDQNPSFVLERIDSVKFEDRPIPQLQDEHDVIVRVKFTGICGSDVCCLSSCALEFYALESCPLD